MKRVFLTGLLLLLFAGCIRTIDERGVRYAPDPNAVDVVAETTIAVGQALSPVVPALGGAVAVLAAGYAAWKKKVKPKMDRAQSEASLNHTTASWLVETIEELKKNQPKTWEKIKPYFKEAAWSSEVEAVIQALRGDGEGK